MATKPIVARHLDAPPGRVEATVSPGTPHASPAKHLRLLAGPRHLAAIPRKLVPSSADKAPSASLAGQISCPDASIRTLLGVLISTPEKPLAAATAAVCHALVA